MVHWDLKELRTPPAVHAAEGFPADAVEPIFFDGPPWRGRATRVFAYLGLPRARFQGRVPAMVLVHGGGGTALDEWVRHWTSRGYAAISVDVCGCTAGGQHGNRPRHAHGGPPGWDATWEQIDEPIEDQWQYHAIAAIARARALLGARPEVDATRIGLMGISWGAYLACIAAGVDPGFALAIPVYGCGFIADDSIWLECFRKLGPRQTRLWSSRWDPSVYLPSARMPMLWVSGTNDFAYPLGTLKKSYLLPVGPRTLCIRVRMPHSHEEPWVTPEIYAFADSLLGNGPPLPGIEAQGLDGDRAWVRVAPDPPVVAGEINWTTDGGPWTGRIWHSAPAMVEPPRALAQVPAGATAYYLNILDRHGRLVSGQHVETKIPDFQGS